MNLVGNNAGIAGGIGSPVGALTFGTDGTLYATFDDTLYTLNLTTGAATAIGDPLAGTGFASISGLAFSTSTLPNLSPDAVPEPASVVLLLLGVAGPGGLHAIRKFRARRAA